MGNTNLLFESLFKRKFSEADTARFLTAVTKDYPYFSAAHFFLLLQTEKNLPIYSKLAAKTSLLFNNNYWLQFQLQEAYQNNRNIDEADTAQDKSPFIKDESGATISTDTGSQQEIEDTSSAPFKGQEEEITAGVEGVQDTANLHSSHLAETETASSAVAGIVAAGENDLKTNNTVPENDLAESTEREAIPGAFENGASDAPEKNAEIIDAPSSTHFNNEQTPLVNEREPADDPVAEKETEPLTFRLNIDPGSTTDENIIFEPLYTSDYFASQGIKLSEEIKPSDKLGKQLKSFTEWLKTMKKIHSDQLQPLEGQSDLSIQKMAEQSNNNDAVLTEAMAEVLLQQGKAEKAIEVYKKLSLLNPAKSAYFAAKIDQLKEH